MIMLIAAKTQLWLECVCRYQPAAAVVSVGAPAVIGSLGALFYFLKIYFSFLFGAIFVLPAVLIRGQILEKCVSNTTENLILAQRTEGWHPCHPAALH